MNSCVPFREIQHLVLLWYVCCLSIYIRIIYILHIFQAFESKLQLTFLNNHCASLKNKDLLWYNHNITITEEGMSHDGAGFWRKDRVGFLMTSGRSSWVGKCRVSPSLDVVTLDQCDPIPFIWWLLLDQKKPKVICHKVVRKELEPAAAFSWFLLPRSPPHSSCWLNLEHKALGSYTGPLWNQCSLKSFLDGTFLCGFPRCCQAESCQFSWKIKVETGGETEIGMTNCTISHRKSR